MKRAVGWMVVLFGMALGGCSSSTTSDSAYSGERAGGGSSGGDYNAGTAPTGGEPAGPPASTSSGTSGSQPGGPQAGTLTAGVWDDTLNFDFFKKYYDATTPSERIFPWAEHEAAKLRAAQSPKQLLDVGVVFDTTGSMGDELRYLQTEMDSIASTINGKFPGAQPRFGLVVYRDKNDAYTTQTYDFSDLATFKARLNEQGAAGGGDIPEAVPEGLAAGVALSWRSDPSVARLMFFVADAPQHAGEEGKVRSALEGAVQKGVKIFPVAASGTSPSAELTMRSAAQYTGGRYIFLTDDSGVGNPHAEPHIPCYNVTRLDKAIVRMAESEMAGTRIEPASGEVIRTVGDPKDGKCTMKDSSQVVLY
ncbi:MAG: VWA domain-containing protein [Deltaproteobacteria bacterium]|nr:VWA domain-containing protein [Deltaproteobacteria bacterium]